MKLITVLSFCVIIYTQFIQMLRSTHDSYVNKFIYAVQRWLSMNTMVNRRYNFVDNWNNEVMKTIIFMFFEFLVYGDDGDGPIRTTYVPSHLYHMIFELLKVNVRMKSGSSHWLLVLHEICACFFMFVVVQIIGVWFLKTLKLVSTRSSLNFIRSPKVLRIAGYSRH